MADDMAVTVRPARAGDGAAVGRIRVEAWRAAYAGIVPDDYLAALDAEGDGRRVETAIAAGLSGRRLVVAETGCEEGGQVVGFAVFSNPDHADTGSVGELHLIYVDPRAQARGVGSVLLGHVLAAVDGVLDALDVWCLEANAGARRFYERHGAVPLVDTREFELSDGRTLAEVGYRWKLPRGGSHAAGVGTS